MTLIPTCERNRQFSFRLSDKITFELREVIGYSDTETLEYTDRVVLEREEFTRFGLFINDEYILEVSNKKPLQYHPWMAICLDGDEELTKFIIATTWEIVMDECGEYTARKAPFLKRLCSIFKHSHWKLLASIWNKLKGQRETEFIYQGVTDEGPECVNGKFVGTYYVMCRQGETQYKVWSDFDKQYHKFFVYEDC